MGYEQLKQLPLWEHLTRGERDYIRRRIEQKHRTHQTRIRFLLRRAARAARLAENLKQK